jgi:hypothetical protein
MAMNITFLGAAGTVTGSRFLLEQGRHRLLVDCGLFQGLKNLRLRNWAPFPFPAEKIGAVLLTHAHLDHSGYLPKLVKDNGGSPVLRCRSDASCSLAAERSSRMDAMRPGTCKPRTNAPPSESTGLAPESNGTGVRKSTPWSPNRPARRRGGHLVEQRPLEAAVQAQSRRQHRLPARALVGFELVR